MNPLLGHSHRITRGGVVLRTGFPLFWTPVFFPPRGRTRAEHQPGKYDPSGISWLALIALD
jgi:hypothetical protein